MATIGKAQIEVAVDAAGVDVGVSKAKRSLAGLADAAAAAGARGGKGVGTIGDGADAAAKKIEQSTRSMVGSIQRATAAMDAGSKSGAKYYESLAAQRGIDPSVLRPYLAQLDAAKAKQDALAISTKTAIPTFHTLTGAISGVQGALAGFAAAAGITWAVGIVKGAIDGMAALHTLSERTGATVEGLSALRGAAKLSSTSMDSVAGAMQRLSKNMVTMDDDGKAATKAIAAIGLSADDLRKMKPDEAFKAIADSLAQYEGGANKVAVAQALMGKSGADMLPMLADLAATGALQAKVTKEQADQAYEFEKSLVKLGATGQGWQKEVAAGMLPALNDFAGALLSVANEASGLRDQTSALSKDGSINSWATSALNAASYVVDAFEGVIRVVKQVGISLASTAKLAQTAYTISSVGAFGLLTQSGRDTVSGAMEEKRRFMAEADADIEKLFTTPLLGQRIRDAFEKTTAAKAKALTDYATATKAVMASYASADLATQRAAQKALKDSYFGADKRVLDFTTTKEKTAKGGGGGTDPQVTQYNQLSEALDKYNAQLAAELAGEAKLTESQKIGLEVKRKLSAADQESFKAALEKARGLEVAIEMQKLWQQAEDEARKSEQARAESLRTGALAVSADAEKIREHTREIGLSQSAIDAIRASRDADTLATQAGELAVLDATGVCTAYSEALRDNIAALSDRAEALKVDSLAQASADAAKKSEADWKQTSSAIEQSLTDALMRGFEAGKDFAINLRDTLVNLFKTLILRPVIQATLSTTGLVSGTAGATTADVATTAATGSYGSIGNLLGTVKSAYDMITGGASNTYAALAKSSIGQQIGLSSINSGGLGVPSVAGGVLDSSSYSTTQLTALGESVGAGLATVGAGLIGSAIGTAIAGDKRIISGISSSTVGAAVGALAGPIGALAGGALGGLLDAAFGSGKKEVKASGISGTFSGSGFDGQNWDFWRKSGGWFGGGKKGTDYSPLDAETGTALSSSFALLKLQTGKAAESLGVDTQQIAAYSKAIQLQLGEDATANSKAISDMLGGISDDLSKLALSGTGFGVAGETASQTLVRLSSSLVAVNDSLALAHLQTLGVSLSAGDMASKLATASGGIDAFKSQISSYYDAYFSAAEKQQDLVQSLTKSFDAMGLALPDSKTAFRSLVESLDLTTTSGAQTFAGMMSLSGAFAQMTDEADKAAQAAQEAAAAQEEARAAAAAAAQAAAAAAAAAAAEAIAAAGSSVSALVDKYSTADDKLLAANAALAQGFATIGQALPQSVAAFLALAKSADLSTTAGQNLVTMLEQLAPSVDVVVAAARSRLEDSRTATQASLDAVISLFGDLSGAMLEMNPPTEKLVESWRRTKTELTDLTKGLAEALGTLPAPNALETLKSTLATLASTVSGIGAINDQVFALQTGKGDQSAVDLLKRREASLFAELATSADPGSVSAKLATTITQRLQIQGKLEEKSINDRYQTEFDAATSLAALERDNRAKQITALGDQITATQKLVDFTKSLHDYVANLRIGDLSPLSPADQLAAASAQYGSVLAAAKGGDATAQSNLQGAASTYLQEAQSFWASATSQYADIFNSVTSSLDSLSSTPVSNLTIMQDQLTQLEAIKDSNLTLQTTAVDTTERQITALGAINTALTAREAQLRQEAEDGKQAAQAQITLLTASVANQEAQIRQHAAEYAVLNAKLEDIAKSLSALESGNALTAASG